MSGAIWTKAFWKDAAERAIATAAQSALAILGVAGLGLLDVDVRALASTVALAAVLAVLKAIVASNTRAGGDASASLVNTTAVPPLTYRDRRLLVDADAATADDFPDEGTPYDDGKPGQHKGEKP